MSLALYLSNVGIPLNAAQSFELQYGACDPVEFCAGLDECARLIAFNERPVKLPPTLEPWHTLYMEIANNGHQPARQTYLDTVPQLPDAVQFAVIDAIDTRADALQQWKQQITASGGKNRKSAEYMQAFHNLGFDFALNKCTFCIEVNGAPITDGLEAEIQMKMHDIGFTSHRNTEYMYKMIAKQNEYHPVKKYLNSLTWAGDPIIENVAAHFESENDVFGVWLKRWAIGAVARVMDETAQNRVLLMEGAQGIGKDYFGNWLGSPLPEYTMEGAVHPDDKDARIRRLSIWIWNISEVGATTRRADMEALKAFITTQYVQERKAFGRFDIRGRAIASFIGSFNNVDGVLNDPTGNRRFMIAPISKIDWGYTQYDVHQFWAQAMALYLAGEPWGLTPDEKQLAEEINSRYETADLVSEILKKYFDLEPGNTSYWMQSADLYDALKSPTFGNLKPGVEIDMRRLATAMRKLGFGSSTVTRRNGKSERGYFGIKKAI